MQTVTPVDVEASSLDMIAELKYRCWARENFVSADQRDPAWHPIVLDEMQRKDAELEQELAKASRA